MMTYLLLYIFSVLSSNEVFFRFCSFYQYQIEIIQFLGIYLPVNCFGFAADWESRDWQFELPQGGFFSSNDTLSNDTSFNLLSCITLFFYHQFHHFTVS